MASISSYEMNIKYFIRGSTTHEILLLSHNETNGIFIINMIITYIVTTLPTYIVQPLWSTSETPFEWPFAGRPMVAQLFTLTGYITSLDTICLSWLFYFNCLSGVLQLLVYCGVSS